MGLKSAVLGCFWAFFAKIISPTRDPLEALDPKGFTNNLVGWQTEITLPVRIMGYLKNL
jgi:hypothetical protein